MKTFLLIPILIFLTLSTKAQTPKTIVNCTIQNGRVEYGQLAKLLPDSVATTLLVDVHKKLNTYDPDLLLLWLEQHDWKLLAIEAYDKGGTSYILSKEIDLDDSARTLFLQKLENLHKK